MRGVALVIALAGCDYTFNLDHLRLVDAGPDAPAPDARPPFDPTRDCPTSYTLQIGETRYRATAAEPAWTASEECANDTDGYTHLAITPTISERDALLTALEQRTENRWWLGAVQPVNATSPGAGWLWLVDEPFSPTLWYAASEPNDLDNSEADHAEQFVIIQKTIPGLVDFIGSYMEVGLCECDGRPITAAAMTALAAYPP